MMVNVCCYAPVFSCFDSKLAEGGGDYDDSIELLIPLIDWSGRLYEDCLSS